MIPPAMPLPVQEFNLVQSFSELVAFLNSPNGRKQVDQLRGVINNAPPSNWLSTLVSWVTRPIFWVTRPVAWVAKPFIWVAKPLVMPIIKCVDGVLQFVPFYTTIRNIAINSVKFALAATAIGAVIKSWQSPFVQKIILGYYSPVHLVTPYVHQAYTEGANAIRAFLTPHVEQIVMPAIKEGSKAAMDAVKSGFNDMANEVKAYVTQALADSGNSVITLVSKTAGQVAGKIFSVGFSAVTSFSIQGTIQFISSIEAKDWAIIGGYAGYIGLLWYLSEKPTPPGIEFKRFTPLKHLGRKLGAHLQSDSSKPIFNKKLSQHIDGVKKGIQNTIKNGTPFDNLLLEGPPGTGKTMIAEIIARESGLNLIKMSGASLAEFLTTGTGLHIKKLREIFDFAEYHARFRPTILFIDEIDVLLTKTLDPARRECLNLFLSKTGTPSNKLMIMGTTNYANDMTLSARQRFGTVLHVGNPDYQSRVTILEDQFKTDLPEKKFPERATLLNKKGIERIAAQTAGISGRELRQLTTQLIRRRGQTENNRLTEEILDEAVHDFLKQRRSIGLISNTGTVLFDFWHFTIPAIKRLMDRLFDSFQHSHSVFNAGARKHQKDSCTICSDTKTRRAHLLKSLK